MKNTIRRAEEIRGIIVMRIAILDESSENVKQITKYVKDNIDDCELVHYSTIFSFVTCVYDDYRGDVDAAFICLTNETDKRIMMAKDLQSFFQHIKIMFYSVNNDMAEQIFTAIPSFFLRLPFKKNKLESAFTRIVETVNEDNEKTLSIRMGGKLFKVKFSSIKYIKSNGRKIIIYSENGYYETYMKLTDILLKLPYYFVRCHRSYVVNVNKINSVSADGILLNKKEFVPISKTYFFDVMNRIS